MYISNLILFTFTLFISIPNNHEQPQELETYQKCLTLLTKNENKIDTLYE